MYRFLFVFVVLLLFVPALAAAFEKPAQKPQVMSEAIGPHMQAVAKPKAATVPTVAVPQSIATAAALQREIRILKLEEQIAQLRQSITEAGKRTSSQPQTNPTSGLNILAHSSKRGTSFPEILSINGRPGHLQATLVLPDGGTITVSGADTVSDTVRILSVSDTGVRAMVGKKNARKMIDLPFYRERPVSSPSATFTTPRKTFSNVQGGE